MKILFFRNLCPPQPPIAVCQTRSQAYPITEVLEKRRGVFEDLGCVVEEEEPAFSDADEMFVVWRAWYYELCYAELLEEHRNELKETVVWNIEEGQRLTGRQIGQAERKRAELYHRVRKFMETYEFLVLPVAQVPPFDVKRRYGTEINGVRMKNYIEWMKSCYYITVTVHHGDRTPRDLGAVRLHPRGAPGGHLDRGPPPRRPQRAPARPRLRAGNRLLEAEAAGNR